MKVIRFAIALFFLCLTQIAAAQERVFYRKYISDCKSGMAVHVPKDVRGDGSRSKAWLNFFKEDMLSANKEILCFVDGIVDIGRGQRNNKKIGKACLDLLVPVLKSGAYNDYIVGRIKAWPKEFYDHDHKTQLHQLAISTSTPHRSMFIELLARIEHEPSLDLIRTELTNPKTPDGQKFYYHIFLATLGEKQSVDWLSIALSKRKMNDDVVENIVPLILSTKQKPLAQWVVASLYDDQPRCYSATPDNEVRIPCGYKVIEHLIPVVKDFPISVDTKGDRETTLREAREWFIKNENYVIR